MDDPERSACDEEQGDAHGNQSRALPVLTHGDQLRPRRRSCPRCLLLHKLPDICQKGFPCRITRISFPVGEVCGVCQLEHDRPLARLDHHRHQHLVAVRLRGFSAHPTRGDRFLRPEHHHGFRFVERLLCHLIEGLAGFERLVPPDGEAFVLEPFCEPAGGGLIVTAVGEKDVGQTPPRRPLAETRVSIRFCKRATSRSYAVRREAVKRMAWLTGSRTLLTGSGMGKVRAAGYHSSGLYRKRSRSGRVASSISVSVKPGTYVVRLTVTGQRDGLGGTEQPDTPCRTTRKSVWSSSSEAQDHALSEGRVKAGPGIRCGQPCSFLESWASSAANPIQQISDDENENDQSNWPDSPARAQTPIQTSSSSK